MSKDRKKQKHISDTKFVLPNLIIGGTLKAGTSSGYTYLKGHPEVCVSSVKETHFFERDYSKNALENSKLYSSYFEH